MTKYEELTLRYLQQISYLLMDLIHWVNESGNNRDPQISLRSQSDGARVRYDMYSKLRDELEQTLKSGK